MSEPDERGIDVAIASFVATRMCGGTSEDAERNAKAMLELFGFVPDERPTMAMYRDESEPRKWGPLARPSDILLRDARARHLCRCVECEGPMPHHTPDMICRRCEAVLAADLRNFDAARKDHP
jgi:hypothetical protein